MVEQERLADVKVGEVLVAVVGFEARSREFAPPSGSAAAIVLLHGWVRMPCFLRDFPAPSLKERGHHLFDGPSRFTNWVVNHAAHSITKDEKDDPRGHPGRRGKPAVPAALTSKASASSPAAALRR